VIRSGDFDPVLTVDPRHQGKIAGLLYQLAMSIVSLKTVMGTLPKISLFIFLSPQ